MYYYYDKVMDRYRIKKKIDGKYISYGTYSNEKEAELVVDELIRVDWDKKELQNIRDKVGVKSVRRLEL